MIKRLSAVLSAVVLALGLVVDDAVASGPTLSPPASALRSSLTSAGDPATGPTPVLLVPGTTLTPEINFSWNYEPALTRAGRAWCAVPASRSRPTRTPPASRPSPPTPAEGAR